ncbi:hypothetical protein SAVIM40S_00140 [Streptomyces avidinii]
MGGFARAGLRYRATGSRVVVSAGFDSASQRSSGTWASRAAKPRPPGPPVRPRTGPGPGYGQGRGRGRGRGRVGQRGWTKVRPWWAAAVQDRFSAAVILRVFTTTALLLPSVPFLAGLVIVSWKNQ